MTRLVRKIKLVMIMGNVYVDMVTKDKLSVHVLMVFTSKGLIIFSLHAQVSLLCIDFFFFFGFIAIIAKFIALISTNLLEMVKLCL